MLKKRIDGYCMIVVVLVEFVYFMTKMLLYIAKEKIAKVTSMRSLLTTPWAIQHVCPIKLRVMKYPDMELLDFSLYIFHICGTRAMFTDTPPSIPSIYSLLMHIFCIQ